MSDMDEIWSQLPLDILQRVVSLLPLVPLFRCRVVCKQWNAWISELNHPQTPAQDAEIFIVSHCFVGPADDQYWFALDTCINKWYKIDCWTWNIKNHTGIGCIPLAAHKNFVLAEVNGGEGDQDFFVCNPGSRSVRSEEIPLRVAGARYEIVANNNTRSYKVYLLSEFDMLGSDKYRRVSEYNSTDHLWTKVCSIPELRNNRVANVHFMAISEEFVHLLVHIEPEPEEVKLFHSLLSYNTIENSWGELGSEIPLFVRDDIRIHHMLIYRGQLLFVGALMEAPSDTGRRYRSIFIRRFSLRKKECVVIAEMPGSFLRIVEMGKLSVSGCGDRIFFLSWESKMVTYCIRDDSWHLHPDLSFAYDKLPEFARCALFQKFISFAVLGDL